MKTAFATLATASMALSAMGAAIDSGLSKVTRADDGVLPHPLGQLGWIGPVGPNGEEKRYEGVDLEDIAAKVEADYGVSILGNSTEEVEEPSLEGRSLERRDYQNCDESRWGLVSNIGITKGINHLRGVGRCIVQARQCIRTTCNDNEAIAWCNDNTYALNFPCSVIADMASLAMWECTNWRDVPFPNVPSTQRFHSTEGWNVILGGCHHFSPSGQPV